MTLLDRLLGLIGLQRKIVKRAERGEKELVRRVIFSGTTLQV